MISRKMIGLLGVSIVCVGVISLGIGVTAVSALTNREKAEKLAELIDKPVEEVVEEKYSGDKTYGEIAEENGVLDQFQEQNANCDGTGNGFHSNDYDGYTHYQHDNDHHNYTHHQYGNGSGYGHGYGRGYGHGRHHR